MSGETTQPVATQPAPAAPSQSVDWSATAWRGVRGFVATLVALVVGSGATAVAGLGAVPVNFSDVKHTAQALVLAFVLGFLAALFKAIRDKWGDPSGSGVVNRLPL